MSNTDDIKAKGRLPKSVKQRAKEEVDKYGAGLAFHFQAYNIAWDGNDSNYDKRLLKEIYRLGDVKKQKERTK